MPRDSERRAVLVSRFSALGDVAMTLPSVYDACLANPDVEFYFLTRHHPAQVFINRPTNLTMATANFVDLHDVTRTKLLRLFMRLAGVRVHYIDKGRRAKAELTRRHEKVLVQLKPMTERYRDVFYRAGIALANDFTTLWGDGRGDPADFASVTPPKRDGERWLAVAPFAKHKGKIYAIERLARRYPSVVNMAAARLGIAAELSLLSHCDVMLSMDSANMHLASLVGLRTVSVWGATHPYTGFLGWGQRTRDVVQLDMTCRPCSVFGDKPCMRGDYHCLAGITPKMIIDRIENI